jgi:ABC-type nitrate/sulfonate/bicarbonate transport system substrate-binding protein
MVSALIVIFLFFSTTICCAFISDTGSPSINTHVAGSSSNSGQAISLGSANKLLFWTQIPPVNQEAAMQAGTIDGDVSWEPFCSAQVSDNVAKILTRSGDIMPDHPSDVLAVHYNSQFWNNETNQQLVARVIRAHSEATDWIVRTINEGTGANYSILVQMAAQFTGLSQSAIQGALENVGYKYTINQAFRNGLADFTSMFANLSMIVGLAGYSNASDFANGIINTSYQEVSTDLSPISTILGSIRIGYLSGNLRSLAEVVAKNASLWGGKDLFQVWGVQVYSPVPYANGGSIMTAFATGNIDMGYLGCAQAILRCINANIPIEIVSAANTEGSAIMVRPDISSLNDLNLRTLATPGPGSIEHLLLLKWAAMNGFEVDLKGAVEVPSPPRDPNATASNGQITLRWLEPENAGGTSITNYTIYRGTSSGGESILTTIGANLSFVDSSVIQGSTYYYKISAINLVGESEQSNETSAMVDVMDTTAPVVSFNIQRNGANVVTAMEDQALVLTANATYDLDDTFSSLNFTWSFGDSTTGYGPWVRHNFTTIKTFSIKLSVRDSADNVANLTKYLIITSSPRPDLHLISMAFFPTTFIVGHQGTIKVNISNVGNDLANLPHLEFYVLNLDGSKTFIGNGTSFTMNGDAATDLNPGQYGLFTFVWTPISGGNFTIQVKAVVEREINTVDNTDTGSIIVASVPGKPTGLHASQGNGQIVLNWSIPAYVGPGMLTYHLFRDHNLVWSGTAIFHNDSGLANGREYVYEVSASNDVGWGANTSELLAMPLGAPEVPENLQVRIGTGFVNFSWSSPSNDGGMPILNYTIMRNPAPSPAIPWTIDAATGITWYNDTSVEAGTTYNYYVTASNQIGTSDVSTIGATALTVQSATNNDWVLYAGVVIGLTGIAGVAFFAIRKRK